MSHECYLFDWLKLTTEVVHSLEIPSFVLTYPGAFFWKTKGKWAKRKKKEMHARDRDVSCDAMPRCCLPWWVESGDGWSWIAWRNARFRVEVGAETAWQRHNVHGSRPRAVSRAGRALEEMVQPVRLSAQLRDVTVRSIVGILTCAVQYISERPSGSCWFILEYNNRGKEMRNVISTSLSLPI